MFPVKRKTNSGASSGALPITESIVQRITCGFISEKATVPNVAAQHKKNLNFRSFAAEAINLILPPFPRAGPFALRARRFIGSIIILSPILWELNMNK